MTAPSDMGGRTEFFAPVIREAEEPVFHERWEGRVFGFANFLLPLLGRNVDILRFGMEQLPREVYLSSYYRRWLGGFETLLKQAGGHLTPGEVEARIAGRSAPARRRVSRLRLMVTSRAVESRPAPHTAPLVRRASGTASVGHIAAGAAPRAFHTRATTSGCAMPARSHTRGNPATSRQAR